MSFSGCMMFLFWFIMYKLLFLKLKSKWIHNLILTIIPFYLFPIPLLKYLFYNFFVRIGIFPDSLLKKAEGIIDKTYAVVNQDYKYYFSYYEKLLLVFMITMALITALNIIHHLQKYFFIRNLIQESNYLPLSKWEKQQFYKLKKKMNIKQKVKLIKLPNVPEPFTIGIFHPIVAIPNNYPVLPQSLQMLLTHELAHIKHKDALFDFIASVILYIHWFNPFSYLFLNTLKETNELYSDETVTEVLPNIDIGAYCSLLIQLSQDKNLIKDDLFTLNFVGSAKRQLKRRIDHLTKCQFTKIYVTIIIGIILITIGVSSTFIFVGTDRIYIDSNEQFSYNSEDKFLVNSSDALTDIVYDNSFLDVNGDIYDCNNLIPKAFCLHSYIVGLQTVHKRDNLKCSINYFYSKRCSKCGNVKTYKFYNTESWRICPH